jgi:RNA polymerase sigma-70 factor (ECF subfamily)
MDGVVTRARAGDRAAFGQLWLDLSPRVAAYLRSHGVAEAEDVTSEVFLAVFRQMDRFSGGGAAFRALVFTVAHRRQVDWHRQRTRRGTWLTLEEGPEPTTPSAESAALAAISDERVVEALGALTPDQRSVLALRVVGELSLEETAAVLGKDLGAVKSLQHRALARLRRNLSAVAGREDLSPDPYPRDALTRLNARHA